MHSSGRWRGWPPPFCGFPRNRRGASTRVDVIASNSRNATIVLKYDPRVEEVQRALLATGNYRGMVDGVAGKNTRLAIAAYQKIRRPPG